MSIRFLKLILAELMALAFVLLPMVPAYAQQDPLFGDACKKAPQSPVCQQAKKQDNKDPIIDTIQTVANLVAIAGGILAVIMIMVGGFIMVTSSGNSEAVANARRRIIYSLLGLVVIALAWTITHLIVSLIS